MELAKSNGKFWQKPLKKTIFTLNINGYAKEITDITYPLIQEYARKIGADFYVIQDRKFPEYPDVYEKLQIYQLAQEMENDWNIFFDSDALIKPDLPDITNHIPFDHVAHHGSDMASFRWKYDRFFKRDGRNIGSCNWCAVASSYCIDLWKPIEDLTLEQIRENINPVTDEIKGGMNPLHLIDDYSLSRNIAMYGLKFITITDIMKKMGFQSGHYLFHQYNVSIQEKVENIKKVLKIWRLD